MRYLSCPTRGRSLGQGAKLPKTTTIDLIVGDGAGGLNIEELDPDSEYLKANQRNDTINKNE